MTNPCTKDLQDHLLKIMLEFTKVCKKYNLTYYLIGGSQLGAVRHQGFIPWDDDFDVGMPRKDYNKLISLPKNVWPKNLEMTTPDSSKNWIIPFGKLVDTNTTLVIDSKAGCCVTGVNIDVFPLDGAGSNKLSARYKFFIFQVKRRLLLYNVMEKKSENFLISKVQAFSKRYASKDLFKSLEAWMKKTDYDKSKIIGNYSGAWGSKEFISKDVFKKPKLYLFEGHQFYGVNDADTYLTSLYGDYMQLPSKDKQKSHHKIIYLDLKTSYLDNREGDQIEK